MALLGKKSTKKKKEAGVKKERDNTLIKKALGALLMLFSVFVFIASVSYLFSWRADHSILNTGMSDFVFKFQDNLPQNIMGKLGALLAHIFVYDGFGIGSFLLYPIFFIIGYNLYFNNFFRIKPKTVSKLLVSAIWVSLVCALLLSNSLPIFSGLLGYGVFLFSKSLIGTIGMVLVLGLVTVFFLYVAFSIDVLESLRNKKFLKLNTDRTTGSSLDDAKIFDEDESLFAKDNIGMDEPAEMSETEESSRDLNFTVERTSTDEEPEEKKSEPTVVSEEDQEEDGLELEIEKVVEEEKIDPAIQKERYGIDEPYDPRLDLRDFQFPKVEFLKQYEEGEKTEVTKEDLEKSKTMIVQTLNNYKIGIAQIKATIGPTVTLFEIVPDKGVRISKIKNLEDDIALSLAALGIRIIAPIPGKGTIGIEVPNKKPEIVSMYSVINSAKYRNSKAELPVCLGKTISNEVFVADLAKMPHLLMAGATGQGKSVGLNAIIVSLLYRKHPAELKFVMIDPKKVELTLFQTIERHYLAKLPGEGDAIITDNKQVITTLNSLCVEMDERYNLLQAALVRNIKEYNEKFKQRKLNPEEGHKYLPYIVVIIDEVADLIMTAGKEVEHPIGRLAQLARA
ncbi:MAG: DNA translocase FtsK 4TM domain-containing protein, partial [Bacteroidota bacterium]